MHELCRNLVFRIVNFQIEWHLLIICKYFLSKLSFIFNMQLCGFHCINGSVEACLLWKCWLHMCPHKPWIAWDILLVLITATGNLCKKCPKQLLKQNSSYSDYFNGISGLYQTAEPQEALWQEPKINVMVSINSKPKTVNSSCRHYLTKHI